MPTYSIQAPNGRTYEIEGPDGASQQDVINEVLRQNPNAGGGGNATPQPAAPKKESIAADLGYSALGGIGNLVAFPGQAYGLATGDMDNQLSKAGKSITDYAQSQQSEGFKARQAKQQAAIAEASKEGFLSEAGTAITSTLKDPVLLGNFIAENIPNLIPGFGISRGTMGVGMRMAAKEIAAQGLEGEARNLALDAAQSALAKKATALAVGASTAQQGADVGAQAYEDIYKKLITQKVPPEQAADKALSLARAAGLSGAAISYLSSRLPGARALEQSFAGATGVKAAGTGAIKGLLGEGASEAVEEGGGTLARNVAMSTVDPTQNLMQGVGTAVGQGALLGGVLGGVAGMRNSSQEAAAQSQADIVNNQREAVKRADALRQTAEGAANKLQDPAYLDALYAQAQAVATKRQQLTDAAKGDPQDKNPLAQVERKNAREALAAFEKSDEVKTLYAELGPAAPFIRQRQAELRKQAAAPAPAVSTPAPFTMQGATQRSMIPETGGVDAQAAQRAAGETERAQYGAGPQVTGYAPDGSPIFARAAAGEDRYGQLMAGLRQLGAANGPDGKKIPGLLQDYQKQAMSATNPAEIAKYSQLYNDTLAQTRAMYDEVNQLYAEQNRRSTAPKLTPLANENVKLTTALDAAKKSGDMAAVQSAAEALQKNIAAGGKNELAAHTQKQAAFEQTQEYNNAQKAKQRGVQPMPTMDLFGSESATSFDERVTQPEAARVAERNAPTGPTNAEESGEPEAMAIAAAQRDADAAAAKLQALTATAAKARADFAAGKRGPEATDNRGTVQADMFAEPTGTVTRSPKVTTRQELEGDLRDALRQKDITQPGTLEHTEALSAIKAAQAALVNRPATSIQTASDAVRLAETGTIISVPEAATGVQGGQRAGAATLQSLQQQIDRLPTDLHPDDAALVSRLQDKLHLIADRKEEAEPVRDWLYRLSSGPQQVLSSTDGPLKYQRPTYRDAKRGLDFATQDIQNILANWDQSGRSESETAETQESKTARSQFAKRKDDRTNFLQQRIPELQEFVLGTAGKKYAKLYSNVLTAMRQETAAAERLANIDQRIQATEQLLKTAPSKEALVAHQRFIKDRWNEHVRTEAVLNTAQETKRMARIQLYAFGEGVDPARAPFEQLEKYRAELGQLTQTTGPKAVTTTRQAVPSTTQPGAGVRILGSARPPGAQSDLFRSRDVDAGVFDTPAEFNAFMAGQGLQEYRKALSLGGITAQRAQELIAPLDARIAHMQKAIATEYAAEKARNANNALTQAQLEAARTAAQFRLDRIANSIADQLLAHQKVLDAATKNVAEIANAAQYVDKLLADNAQLFGDSETAFATAMDKLMELEYRRNKTAPDKIADLQSKVDALRVTIDGYLENGPAELSQFVERLEELEYRRNKLADKLQAVQATYEQARTDLLAATDSVSAVYGTERQTSIDALAASKNGIDRLRADEAQRLVDAGEAKAARQLLHNAQMPPTQAQLEAQQQEILSSVSNRTVYGSKTAAVPTQGTQTLFEKAEEYRKAIRRLETQQAAGKLNPTTTVSGDTTPMTLASAKAALERVLRNIEKRAVRLPGETISFEGHRRLVTAYAKAMGEAAAYRKALARLQEREAAGETNPTMAVKGEAEPMTLASAEASLNRLVRRAKKINKLLDREGETEKAQLEKDVVSAREKADKWQKAVAAARGALSAATRKANKEATPENVAAQAAAVKARDNAVKQSGIWNTALGDALAARNRGPGISGMERTPLNQEAAPQEYTDEVAAAEAKTLERERERLLALKEAANYEPQNAYEADLMESGQLRQRRETVATRTVGSAAGSGFRTSSPESRGEVTQTFGGRTTTVGPRENPRNPITETGSIKTTKAPFGVTEVDESNRTAEQLVQQEAQDVLAGNIDEGSPEARAYADASRAFNLASSEVSFAADAVQRAEDDFQDARVNPSKDPDALKTEDYAQELLRTQSILAAAEKKYAKTEDAKETAAVKLRQQKSAAQGGNSRLIADDAVADYAITETGKIKVPKMGPGLRTGNVRLAEKRKASEAAEALQAKEELYNIDESSSEGRAYANAPRADSDDNNFYDNDLLRGTSGPNDTPLGIGAIRALNNDNLRGALAQIAANSKNPIARRLAAQYVTLIGNVRVRLVEEMPGNNPAAPGGITRDGLNIFLNRNTGLSEETLLHEVSHALTIHQLDVLERMLTPDQRAAKRELEAMHEAIKQATELNNAVVKQNDLKEFVAESYGSNQVQKYMQGQQWQDPNAPKLTKPQAMWAAIKSAFMRLIGAKVPPKGTPMHERFMELADKFLRTPEKGDYADRNLTRFMDGSKVTNEDGSPKRVYHGTAADNDFAIFDTGRDGESGPGAYFTDSADGASFFARVPLDGRSDEPSRIVPAYLRITKPYVIGPEERLEPGRLRNPVLKRLYKRFGDPQDGAALKRAMQAEGYDGIIREWDTGEKHYVVFNARQVKSAIGNSGEYSLDTRDMLYRDPLTAALNKGFSGKPSVRQVYADNKTNIVLAARQNVADQRAALREVTSLIGTREEKADMALTITMLDSTTSGTMATLAHGALRLNAKGQLEAGTNTSFKAVLDEIGKFPGIKGEQALNLFHIQRVADRANAIPGGWRILAGKDAAAKQADAKLVSDKINSNPALKAAVDRANTVYNEFNRGKLELLRDTHALAADDIDAMLKDKNYVPYYRQNGDTVNLIMPDGQPRSVGDIRTNPLLRSLKGGDENLLGFVDGEVKNAHLLTRLAIENLGKQKVAARMVELGKTRTTRLVGKPSMIVRPGMGAPDANKIEFRVESTGPKDDGMRHLIINTEGTIAESIPSTLVTQAMAGAYTNHNMLTDISNAMSGLLRSAVTRFPLYTLRQLFREPFAASVQGNVRSNPAMAVVKSIWEYGKIMAGTSAEAKFLESHGIVESQVFGGTHDLSKVAKQITGGGTWWTDRVAMWLDKSALAADAATRTQAFKDVLAKGGSQTEALLQAREMQNFSRHGSAAWVQLLGHSIPFFNSSIQSLDNLLRSAQGKMPNEELMNTKRTFALRAAGMMAMAAMYYAQMDDDEEWRKLSLRDKISYIHLPVWMGGDRMRLPAPFEIGMLFFSLPMAIMEHVKYGLTAEDWKIVGGAILGQTPGGGSFIPQIAKLPRDLLSNYNSFTGQPITPRSKEGLSPEAQFGPGTSQAARRAGELTGVSPFKIDYAMGQLVGQWAKIAGSATESLFQKASQEGIEKPSTTMADNPIYGSLFQNTRSNTDVEHVYAAAAETKEAKATFDSLRKQGLGKDAQQFMEANRQAIALAPYMQKFVTELGNIKVMEERIRNMPSDALSPDAKKERINMLTTRKQVIAKQYAAMLKQLETK